jgi:hypothetical protein
MADRTESRLTRDLMLEAVPFITQKTPSECLTLRSIDPDNEEQGTYKFFSQHFGSTRDLVLGSCNIIGQSCPINLQWRRPRLEEKRVLLTNNERNHGCAISSSCFQTFDQFLNLPYLDIFLRIVCLRCAHAGQTIQASRPPNLKETEYTSRQTFPYPEFEENRGQFDVLYSKRWWRRYEKP